LPIWASAEKLIIDSPRNKMNVLIVYFSKLKY